MKKFFAYSGMLLSLAALVLASSPYLMKKIKGHIPDPNRNGDLYMMSALPGFKDPHFTEDCPTPAFHSPKLDHVALYILGDSYTKYMKPASFNTAFYHFIHWDDPPHKIAALDSTKRNILIIECTERQIRERFGVSFIHNFAIQKNYHPETDPSIQPHKLDLQAEDNLKYLFTFNKEVGYFKNLKASFNRMVFDRVDKDVYLDKQHQRLYLSATVDTEANTSSFRYLPDQELRTMVKHLNEALAFFQKAGFSAVYFSVMPNPVSLIAPQTGSYNHLVERLQTAPGLKMPYIDAWHLLSPQAPDLYFRSDTHWNCAGRDRWLQAVDSLLHQEAPSPERP